MQGLFAFVCCSRRRFDVHHGEREGREDIKAFFLAFFAGVAVATLSGSKPLSGNKLKPFCELLFW